MSAREEVLARIRAANRAAGSHTPPATRAATAAPATTRPGSPPLLNLLRDRLVVRG